MTMMGVASYVEILRKVIFARLKVHNQKFTLAIQERRGLVKSWDLLIEIVDPKEAESETAKVEFLYPVRRYFREKNEHSWSPFGKIRR